MRQEQVTSLRNLLSAVVPKGKLSPAEIDALVQYMAEVTKTEDEAIQRLSGILQNDLNGISTWKMILQVELLRRNLTDHEERLRTLERHGESDDGKWSMAQKTFTLLSFIAAIMALLKAFGLLKLP